MNKEVKIINLGSKDFKETWEFQESLLKRNVDLKIDNKRNNQNNPTENYLLIVEHPHVYTLGKSGDSKNLLLSEHELKKQGIDYYPINRGGDITYHGPGQLVVYPIIDLENFVPDLGKYLRDLEQAVIDTLRNYDIESGRINGLTGVWLDFKDNDPNPRKICAIGIKSSRWITMHGLAFNLKTDLKYFDNIIPCGIDDKAVTSLEKEIEIDLNVEIVTNQLIDNLIKHIGIESSQFLTLEDV